MPMPCDHDPGPKFFYENFVKPLIPDVIQMMSTGLCVDQDAVEELRKTIHEVLGNVEKTLSDNSLIQQFQEHRLPAAQKAHAEKCTQAVRTSDYYLKSYKEGDLVHRTWVINTYLKHLHKERDCREKWTIRDLKQYNIFLKDAFVTQIIDKRKLSQNTHVLSGMKALAEYKAELWNRPRQEKAAAPVDLAPFNPGSNKQMREFFEMLEIEPLAFSKKTGEASWGREQVELVKYDTQEPVLLEALEAFIDFSYGQIIQSNFLKAFDTFTIDGILHGNIKIFGAKSFRPTSNSPNLLNMPSTRSIYAKPLKRCFIAPDGMVIYAIDLKGLEDRVIANLSGDTNKCNIFLEGLDGHSLNACGYFKDRVAEILGPNHDNVEYVKRFFELHESGDKTLEVIRQDSKAPTFKLAYGGYPDADRGGVITKEIFENYHQVLYPGITEYREGYVLPTTKRQGYIHLGLGCRMYSSDPDSHIRTLNNATVQFWSILTQIVINEFNHRIREADLTEQVQVISSIYDSIYVQCDRDPTIIKWVNDNLVELLTVQYLKDQIIPNEAQGEIGLNWADVYKVSNNATINEIEELLYVMCT
jgi:hypothetical protein